VTHTHAWRRFCLYAESPTLRIREGLGQVPPSEPAWFTGWECATCGEQGYAA